MSKSTKNLESIFYPQSVAVVGANKVVGTVPYDILANILKSNFQGAVYPVSPKERSISGVKAYKYILDIPDPIDLAVLVFPSSVCHMAVEQCGKKGVKSAIIISAGFKETGPVGVERERQIKEIAAKYGISFIGPNCLGVINTDPISQLNASFARQMPEEGNIGFLSQSGALCTAVLDYARAKHIGFSKFVSFGNKADISEIDLLYYLRDDPKTKVILIYLEEISDGRALLDAARNIIAESGKPILAIKSGRTSEGAAAAASHTGSLAGSDEVCDAAFRQAGIIRCSTIEEMFNYAIALAYQPLPRSNRIAIITNAGGPGVLATDAAIDCKLELARFSEDTTNIFKKHLPKTANINNPVDVIGDARADRYNIALSSALKDDNVDGVCVILTPQSMTDIEAIAREVCLVADQFDKPLYASFMGEADVAAGIDILQRDNIPHYILPESMCKSFACAYRFKQYLEKQWNPPTLFSDVDKAKAHAILDAAIKNNRTYIPEYEATKILEAYGLPTLRNGIATTQEEAISLAQQIGFPVVMKIISEDIVHKFDVKGVVLKIRDEKDAEKAYDSILANVKEKAPDAVIKGVNVQKMVSHGKEVILGFKRDPSFGVVTMFGLGGIFVEIFKDVSFRVAPVDPQSIGEMIREVKSYPILSGARGTQRSDIKAIEESIQRLSQLAIECPQIQELDVNPLIVNEQGEGCFVADARIML
ncbi:MAG: CoA-binding protein [Candidatus Omnitrophota bacterium]|jgi:acetyltransferase|nr:MAG: CoA-binding protein [Candidatus Omnitrophota bacterium]